MVIPRMGCANLSSTFWRHVRGQIPLKDHYPAFAEDCGCLRSNWHYKRDANVLIPTTTLFHSFVFIVREVLWCYSDNYSILRKQCRERAFLSKQVDGSADASDRIFAFARRSPNRFPSPATGTKQTVGNYVFIRSSDVDNETATFFRQICNMKGKPYRLKMRSNVCLFACLPSCLPSNDCHYFPCC